MHQCGLLLSFPTDKSCGLQSADSFCIKLFWLNANTCLCVTRNVLRIIESWRTAHQGNSTCAGALTAQHRRSEDMSVSYAGQAMHGARDSRSTADLQFMMGTYSRRGTTTSDAGPSMHGVRESRRTSGMDFMNGADQGRGRPTFPSDSSVGGLWGMVSLPEERRCPAASQASGGAGDLSEAGRRSCGNSLWEIGDRPSLSARINTGHRLSNQDECSDRGVRGAQESVSHTERSSTIPSPVRLMSRMDAIGESLSVHACSHQNRQSENNEGDLQGTLLGTVIGTGIRDWPSHMSIQLSYS